jgi:hypothetical protein
MLTYEIHASGTTPATHRVEWRGPAMLTDGADLGLDLTGRWFDAGDDVVWTGNDAFAMAMLAWALHRHEAEFRGAGQWPIGVDRLREIGGYLERCVLRDGSGITGLVCGKGSTQDRPEWDDPAADNDRTEGGPNEGMDAVVAGAPQQLRPTYWVDAATGGDDIAGAIAYGLAIGSTVLRRAGDAATADRWLAAAKAAYAWGAANPDRSLVLTMPGTSTTRATAVATRSMTAGTAVTVPDYPSRTDQGIRRMLFAAAWLHRAERAAGTPGYTAGWIDTAAALLADPRCAGSRDRHWDTFASGSEHNGAYAPLAADSGRAAFVGQADAYADFWLYDRQEYTGRPGDPTTTPDGFVCRGNAPNWNAQAFVDQAPPLLEWADSPFRTSATRSAHAVALFTATYSVAGKPRLCPVRQIDYLPGSNSRHLSYLAGYAPAGADWVRNLHLRPVNAMYGGFGTPAADQPAWNRFTPYGILAPGPGPTDDFPQTTPLTSGTDIAYQEPVIYTGGLLTVLARNIALGDANTGAPLAVFPPLESRPSDYQVREFFAGLQQVSATRFRVRVNNRSYLPSRRAPLGFRWYFTPDGVDGSQVACTATGLGLLAGESAVAGAPAQDAAGRWFIPVRLHATVVQGEFSRCRREVQLDFTQPGGGFVAGNDHAAAGATTAAYALAATIPVYDRGDDAAWQPLGGRAPDAGVVRFRRASIANHSEAAGSIAVVVERIGGRTGAVSATIAVVPGTARHVTAPTGAAATATWADGAWGERTLSIPLIDNAWNDGRRSFQVVLGGLQGGVAAGAVTATTVFVEDDDQAAANHPPLIESLTATPAAAMLP